MAGYSSVQLTPPLFEKGSAEGFKTSGRTLKLTFSPRDDSVAIFPTSNTEPTLLKTTHPKHQPIYFALDQNPPLSERRTFISDVSIIFAAIQNLIRQKMLGKLGREEEEFLQKLRKLAIDYDNFCRECWAFCSREPSQSEPFQYDADHYRKLATCWSLFTALYIPEIGMEAAPCGDDLMEWLNTNYIEPSTGEGDHLSKLDKPWEDETFWPYLTRATLRGLSKATAFFLDVLSQNHPSDHLQRLAQRLSPLLTDLPRLNQFDAEKDFALASRRWKDKVKTLRIELDRVPEDARDDGFDNWWDRLSDIIGILEGRAEVLKRVCAELGADWKEVCIAWTIFVDPRLRRHELPDIVVDILDEMPPDPTNLEDSIHSSLFLGKPHQALAEAHQLDPWLSAHLADVMEAIRLIDSDISDSGLTLRQWYVVTYAEYLHTDPGLWRLTVGYLCYCGDIGKEMADEVLVRVPLQLQRLSRRDTDGVAADDSAKIRDGDLAGVLKDVHTLCFEHQREGTRRAVCRIAAQIFLDQKEFGLAVAYATSAEDWPGLGRIVDRVLEEYFAQNPANFARLVANIAPSLQTLRAQQESISSGVFVYRLMFAVRLAEFHQRQLSGELHEAAYDIVAMLRDDVAPKAWWAVILSESVELLQNEEMLFTSEDACILLRKLEEICTRSAQNAGSDYLPILARTTKSKDEKGALQRLQIIRLALAKYYARCGVIGVGGRVEPNSAY